MTANAHSKEQDLYQIEIAGSLDARWSEWFSGLTITAHESEPPRTTLTGRVDQTALRGIVNRLWDLNLTLISVQRLCTSPCRGASREEKGART